MEQPKRYYIPDLESGYNNEVTEGEYKRWLEFKKAFEYTPKPSQYVGQVMIFGTSGELDNYNEDLAKMFYEPKGVFIKSNEYIDMFPNSIIE